MDPLHLVDLAFRYASSRGVDEVEVYAVWGESTKITMSRRGIESVVSGMSMAIGLRLIKDKRVSIVGGHVSTEDGVRKIVEIALNNLRACPRDDNWVSLAKELGYTPVADVNDPALREQHEEHALNLASSLAELPNSVDDRAYLSSASITCGVGGKAILNSYGSKILSFERTGINMSFEVKIRTDRGEGSIYEHFAALTLRELDLDKLVTRAVNWAKLCAGGRPVETGRYDVVLAPKVFGSITRILLVPAISALNVQRGRSPLKNMVGQRVLSDKLTVVDDGAAPGLENTEPFDDEGVATRRKIVFERGVLATYLYDSYTAYIEGKEPTGNAVRPGVSSPPSPSSTNLLVVPGTGSLEDLVKEVRRGVLVLNVIGEWLSNYVNGMLNFTISAGVLIENGELTKPISGSVVTGNIYELLSKHLEKLGGDVENVMGVYAPSILLRSVSIAGR